MQRRPYVGNTRDELWLHGSRLKPYLHNACFRLMKAQQRGASTFRMDKRRPVPVSATESEVSALWKLHENSSRRQKTLAETVQIVDRYLWTQETRIAFKDSTTADKAPRPSASSDEEGSEKVKLLHREASGSFKIMGLTPSAELVAISMGELT